MIHTIKKRLWVFWWCRAFLWCIITSYCYCKFFGRRFCL